MALVPDHDAGERLLAQLIARAVDPTRFSRENLALSFRGTGGLTGAISGLLALYARTADRASLISALMSPLAGIRADIYSRPLRVREGISVALADAVDEIVPDTAVRLDTAEAERVYAAVAAADAPMPRTPAGSLNILDLFDQRQVVARLVSVRRSADAEYRAAIDAETLIAAAEILCAMPNGYRHGAKRFGRLAARALTPWRLSGRF